MASKQPGSDSVVCEPKKKRKHMTISVQQKVDLLRKLDKGVSVWTLCQQYNIGADNTIRCRLPMINAPNTEKSMGRTKSREGQGMDLPFDQQGKASALTFNPYQELPWKVGPREVYH
ncbi:hypothetical protein E2C01_039906 [Portunus trituberculatus]|uniref:HTH psq-type domain-containing protein n=1 Tax=Portunus trituberculatus TaxID=210409 RepID=A0A5B7FL94_PORTR|nr:hypothetical protein [Portunus trituberculatus]